MKRRVSMHFNGENYRLLYAENQQGEALRALLNLLVQLDVLDGEVTVCLPNGQTGKLKWQK